MKLIKTTIITIIIIANAIAAIAMITCAYASTIHPAEYPSCSYLGMLLPATILINLGFILLWLFIKRFWTLISIAALIICYSPIRDYCPINIMQKDSPAQSLKFLSYNVMGFGNKTNGWEDNAVLDYLLNSNADVICLQEAYTISNTQIQEILRQRYQYIGICETKDSHLAVVSRLPIVGTQDVDFPESTNHCCMFKLLTSQGDTIAVFNAHLESYHLSASDRDTYDDMLREAAGRKEHTDTLANGEGWDQAFFTLTDKLEKANVTRSHQADTLAQIINQTTSKYIVLCGDFNDTPLSYTHRTLTQNLNDAYTMTGNGPGISYNKNHMYFRIDNILITPNITPYSAKVDNSIKESDHYPIFCYLELQ